MRSQVRPLLLGALLGLGFTIILGCSRSVERRNPIGEIFPSVTGKRLSGEAIAIPADFAGAPVVLLVGYVQRAQFDIDRWLLGFTQAETPVRVLEIPTIKGWAPRVISGWIDSGMRSGIPEEDWRTVATVYRDAPAIVKFLGNEDPQNGRAVLLDADGRVLWMHDRGYSAAKMLELHQAVLGLNRPAAGESQPAAPKPEARVRAPEGEEAAMIESLNRFKQAMNRVDSRNLDLLEEIYSEDVVFEDPLHRVSGRPALREYFARMYDGVASCEFEFSDEVVGPSEAAVVWTMRMRHERFRPNETLELPGMSFLRFRDGRVVHHRDSFDVGAMIYERVPLLGGAVRYIKGRLKES